MTKNMDPLGGPNPETREPASAPERTPAPVFVPAPSDARRFAELSLPGTQAEPAAGEQVPTPEAVKPEVGELFRLGGKTLAASFPTTNPAENPVADPAVNPAVNLEASPGTNPLMRPAASPGTNPVARPEAAAAGSEEPVSGETETDAVSLAAAGQLQAAALPVRDAPPPAAVAGTAPAGEPARYEELVDRILVSQPRRDGGEEVRVRLDPRWLPDTEVRLTRSAGALEVEFVADGREGRELLAPHLSELRDRLEKRAGEAVTVRMTGHTRDGGDREGRSRNRRAIYEELSGRD